MTATPSAAVPVGIGFTPFEHRADVIEDVAMHAEQRGFAFIAVAEAMSLAAPIVLARLSERTQRIGLMTGVLSVWSRTPATLALTASELQRQSQGRFVLGLGASTPPITEGFHGQSWERPLERLQQATVAVRALLAGERLPAAPSDARPLRLAAAPEQPVPVALAAITPASIRVVGRVADMWLPFLVPPASLNTGREIFDQVAAECGRRHTPSVNVAVPLAVAPTEAAAAAVAARWLLTYTTRMGPVYPKVLRAHGYQRELDALIEANDNPHQPVLPSAATRLAEDVLLFGTYDDAAELLRRWQSHADAIALVAPFGLAAEQIRAGIDAFVPSRASDATQRCA